MRRFWFLLLAVAMALAIALPAGAGKPPTKPKRPSSAPVAATLSSQPVWVHEAGDVIWYSVTVENKTRSPIDATIVHPDGSTPVTITEPRGVAEYPNLFSYEVTGPDVAADIDIVGSVTVGYEGGEVVAQTSTVLDPVDDCEFDEGIAKFTERGLCIWKPSLPGTWEVSAVPEPEPPRPARLMMTMRDGVPGNWCTLQNGDGGIVQDRWMKSSESIVLNVFLPDHGECVLGGHGVCTEGDCYFAVGNPKSFYLYTTFDGFITPTKTAG